MAASTDAISIRGVAPVARWDLLGCVRVHVHMSEEVSKMRSRQNQDRSHLHPGWSERLGTRSDSLPRVSIGPRWAFDPVDGRAASARSSAALSLSRREGLASLRASARNGLVGYGPSAKA